MEREMSTATPTEHEILYINIVTNSFVLPGFLLSFRFIFFFNFTFYKILNLFPLYLQDNDVYYCIFLFFILLKKSLKAFMSTTTLLCYAVAVLCWLLALLMNFLVVIACLMVCRLHRRLTELTQTFPFFPVPTIKKRVQNKQSFYDFREKS